MRMIGKLALASVSILSLATPAMAQNAEEGVGANDIIVQARRKDESVQDVPLVVQAVTAQELTKLNIRDFKDVQNLVPGLSLAQSANGIGTQSTLRGVAFDVNASGNNGTIEFYMNDAPLSSSILFQSMFDVGQIEVLRGPQGTLRGRASPSGSITVTTRKPDLTEAGGYMTGTLNDIGGWNVNGAINVPIIEDKLGVRIAGVVDENEDNRVRSLNSSIKPNQQNRGMRASVRFDPFDILSLNFSYTHTERKVVDFDQVESVNVADPAAPASPVLIRGKDRLAVMAAPRVWSQNFQVFNWQAELRLMGQKLNYVGSYNKQRYRSIAPNDSGGFFAKGFSFPVQEAGLRTFTHGHQENHELRLSSDERVAGIFDYVVGYLWNKLDSPTDLISNTVIFSGTPSASPSNLVTIVNTPIARTGGQLEKSYFANVTAHLGEATEVSGGIRRLKFHSEGALLISGVAVPAANEDKNRSATIYSASLKHRFNENLMAYASFGTSWRPGGSTNATIMRDNVAPTALLSSLYFPGSEKSKSFELGIKSNFLDNRLTLNVSAYHQTFKNFAYFARNTFFAATDVTGGNRVIAATGIAVGVPAKVDGVEAEVQFRPTDNWDLGIVAAYAKSKIKNGSIPCNAYFPHDGIPDRSSAVPTYAEVMAATNGGGVALCNVNYRAGLGAPFSATIQSEYRVPVGDAMDGYLRGLVTYNNDSQNDPTNAFDDIKAYALVNLYAGLRSSEGDWEVGAFVKNLFDTHRALIVNNSAYATPYRTFTGAGNAVNTYRGSISNNPRELGITARISFGSR